MIPPYPYPHSICIFVLKWVFKGIDTFLSCASLQIAALQKNEKSVIKKQTLEESEIEFLVHTIQILWEITTGSKGGGGQGLT